MSPGINLSIGICFLAFLWLIVMLRSDRISLGLPIACLGLIFLNHVPGAFAHTFGEGFLATTGEVQTGIYLTAVGSVFFVGGVWLARFSSANVVSQRGADRKRFWIFCLVGGWIFTYGLSFLRSIPSLGAIVEHGGGIWVLGVMLGLRASVYWGDRKGTYFWLAALTVYPVTGLLLSGFLSYASRAVVIVGCALIVSSRSLLRVVAFIGLTSFVGLTVFVNYFIHRDDIRAAVWGGAPMEERIDVVIGALTQSEVFNPGNNKHLMALDERLNQNFFIGRAAQQIGERQVDFVYGRSIWEGVLSLIPRALWPDKPVFAGSPAIVAEMTGLELSTTTSWGVGNVMEFYINFGMPSLIGGFLLLGWILGTLDRKAAAAEIRGDLVRTILFFLPGAALIQPLGSLVELTGGAAAAAIAAYGWKWAWTQWAVPPTRLVANDVLNRS